jgi:hypothetical protein
VGSSLAQEEVVPPSGGWYLLMDKILKKVESLSNKRNVEVPKEWND